MKTLCMALAVWVALAWNATAAKSETSVGDTQFAAFEGSQSWPTGEGAQVISDYAVPIYVGLPTKHYRVLGRIFVSAEGVEVVGRAFDEGLGSEKRRLRHVANQAKQRGAEAVLVTSDERVTGAFKLTKKELKETTPLFDHKDKITLAVKFE